MQEERKRILQLVENGTISAEEAIVLLEKLSSQKESTPTPVVPTFEQQKEEPHKADPIFEEQKQKRKTTGFEDIFGKSFNDKEFTKKMDELLSRTYHNSAHV